MSELQRAQEKFNKVDRIFRKLAIVFVVFMFSLVLFLTYEVITVQQTIARNQTTNAAASAARFQKYTKLNEEQHKITQKYVLCVSKVLLLPLADRTEEAFDQCSATIKL